MSTDFTPELSDVGFLIRNEYFKNFSSVFKILPFKRELEKKKRSIGDLVNIIMADVMIFYFGVDWLNGFEVMNN